jgi:hypothetical protein
MRWSKEVIKCTHIAEYNRSLSASARRADTSPALTRPQQVLEGSLAKTVFCHEFFFLQMEENYRQ